MSQTVIGIFNNSTEAQEAVDQLIKNGFDRSSIDVSSSNSSVSGNTTATGNTYSDTAATGTAYSNTGTTYSNNDEGDSKIGKFFKSLFGGDDDSDTTGYSKYSKAAEKGTIVTVHASSSDKAEDAADILDNYGAVNVDEDSEHFTSATGTASTGTTASSLNVDQTAASSIPVIEEKLQVGKKTIETGGVRLRSRIVERPVEESLRLREERVYVDRTPVNRLVTGSELDSFKEGTIELTESAEIPVVAKEAYVKEEIRLGKDVSEREETIHETVRSTEVDVENLGTDTTTGRNQYGTTNTTGNL